MYRVLFTIFLITTTISATESTTTTSVFIECKYCNEDFIKEEILNVDYVRDRHDADIHILETTQKTIREMNAFESLNLDLSNIY